MLIKYLTDQEPLKMSNWQKYFKTSCYMYRAKLCMQEIKTYF